MYKGLADSYKVQGLALAHMPSGGDFLMNYNIFDRLVASVYQEKDAWPLEGYIYVFHKYFDTYEEYFQEPHPHISKANIRKLMDKMPYLSCESRHDTDEYLDPDSYDALIERYFELDWQHCDYNVNHFFSGQIREMRFYETCY